MQSVCPYSTVISLRVVTVKSEDVEMALCRYGRGMCTEMGQ